MDLDLPSGPQLVRQTCPRRRHIRWRCSWWQAVWRRDGEGYNQKRVGLAVREMESVPAGLSAAAGREHYDTGTIGYGAGGHLFPEELSEEQKRWVLAYLKSL